MRTKNAYKNLLTNIIPFFIIGILGFVKVRVFADFLGNDIMSINQLFFTILAYLSLAEVGVGLFVIQKYYICFVNNDKKKIKELYATSNIYFKKLAKIVFGISCIISLLLPLFTSADISHMYLILVFLVFVFKNIIDYYYYAPKMVLEADQKMFKINICINMTRIIENVVEITLAILGFNYLLVIIPGIFVRIISNKYANGIVKKEYPWLTDSKVYKKEDLKGVTNLLSQRITGIVFKNTDVLLISSFLTPLSVVMYTSYNYITKYLFDISYMVSQSLSSSLANVLHKEKLEHQHNVFTEVNTFYYFFGSIFLVLFIYLVDPFIKIWLGEEYLFNEYSVYAIAIVMFLNITCRGIVIARDSLGMFKETKKIIIVEAILNIVLSLVLIQKYEIAGVLTATIISNLLTTFWFIPKLVYKTHFKRSSSIYFKNFTIVSIINVIIILFNQFVLNFDMNTISSWIISAALAGAISVIILIFTYYIFVAGFKEISMRAIKIVQLKISKKQV